MYARRGLGQAPGDLALNTCVTLGGWLTNSSCWGHSIPYWQQMMTPGQSSVGSAPPPAPTGSVLTTPPASGAEAQATVDQLLNEQMAAQQAVNAQQVSPTVDIYSAVNSLNAAAGSVLPTLPGVNWTTVALVSGAALVLLILMRR
jgi:hypothetical protein